MQPHRLFVGFIALTVALSVWAHVANFHGAVICADGQGYYEYLPAFVAYHDPWLQRLGERPDADRLRYMLSWALVETQRDGRHILIYPMGTAILWSPFYGLAAAYSAIHPTHPANPYSYPYQAAVSTAATCYLVLALILLYQLGRERAAPASVVLALAGIVYGTNLFHYATFDASFSHVYAFFAVSLLLFSVRTFFADQTCRNAVLMGAALGLVVLVRQTDVIAAAIVVAYFLEFKPGGRRLYLALALAAAVFLVTIFPQFLYYRLGTGRWFFSPYMTGGYTFTHRWRPRVYDVLVSLSQHGVLVWSPYVALGLIGALAGIAHGPQRWIHAGVLFIFSSVTLMYAMWFSPHLGCGFGHRGFIDIMPLLFLSLLTLFPVQPGFSGRYAALLIVTLACAVYSSLLMRGYWNGIIPMENVTVGQWGRALLLW
jgi:hypothetical protein